MPLTPQRVLRNRILMVLTAVESGAMPRVGVLSALDERYSTDWTAEDMLPPASRPFERNWQNRARYERADMVRDGLLQDRADRVWALTSAGLAHPCGQRTGLHSSPASAVCCRSHARRPPPRSGTRPRRRAARS
jgi:hypothetical protein